MPDNSGQLFPSPREINLFPHVKLRLEEEPACYVNKSISSLENGCFELN